MLKRDLSKLDGYATIIGMMIGAGIFVAIGEAGQDAGPSTVFAYLLLGPITLLLALPYVIFQSTSLGNLTGGAYIHISRTFKNHYVAFIVMWLTWVTYLGVIAVLSLSVGRYLQASFPFLNPKIIASLCLALFYIINLTGVKQFGRMQRMMFYVLIASIIVIVLPGLSHIQASNFSPLLPNGWSGFFKALPILFFAYAGFDALSQTAGETKDARKSLPRIFVIGISVSVVLYIGISLIVFGTLPYSSVVISQAPVVDAARSFLPFGTLVVTIAALMAFLSTINACMLVPSRILYAFAQDRVAPSFLSNLSERFGTPYISLTINFVIAMVLIWTKNMEFLIGISMQSLIILYFAECVSLACLPFVNKPLWRQVSYNISKKWVVIGGVVGALALIVLYVNIPNPVSVLLLTWVGIGTIFYVLEKTQGKKASFDYETNLTGYLHND